MLFTVINYLPLLEEEVPHANKAPLKKGENKEGSGEPDDDMDPEQEISSVLSGALCWAHPRFTSHVYENCFHHYDYLLDGTCTPPPEK